MRAKVDGVKGTVTGKVEELKAKAPGGSSGTDPATAAADATDDLATGGALADEPDTGASAKAAAAAEQFEGRRPQRPGAGQAAPAGVRGRRRRDPRLRARLPDRAPAGLLLRTAGRGHAPGPQPCRIRWLGAGRLRRTSGHGSAAASAATRGRLLHALQGARRERRRGGARRAAPARRRRPPRRPGSTVRRCAPRARSSSPSTTWSRSSARASSCAPACASACATSRSSVPRG